MYAAYEMGIHTQFCSKTTTHYSSFKSSVIEAEIPIGDDTIYVGDFFKKRVHAHDGCWHAVVLVLDERSLTNLTADN